MAANIQPVPRTIEYGEEVKRFLDLLRKGINDISISGGLDHTLLANIGTNTHTQIDTHIADATIHFTEGSIDHTAITNIGTNTHAQIDTHIANQAEHPWTRTGTTLNPVTSTDQIEWDEFYYQDATTGGTSNLIIGVGAGNVGLMTGGSNTYIGKDTGGISTTAANNVGIGVNVMPAVIGGGSNVGIGVNSLLILSSGTGNFGLGVNVLRGCSTSSNNVAIGTSAGRNTNGQANLAIGTSALYTATSGDNNVAIGTGALSNGLTPSLNIAIGAFSLASTTTSQCVGIGYTAGRYNLGAGNTFIGYASGMGVSTTSTARFSVGIGANSLISLTTGNNNTSVGYGAGQLTTTAGGCVYLGYNAGYNNTTTWNELYIANSSTATPLLHGNFAATTLKINGQLQLIASTTALAPLNLATGTAPTTPNAGDLWFTSNNNLDFAPIADTRTITMATGTIIADTTVSNTVTETVIYTSAISADEWHVGQVVNTRILGRFSTANASDSFTARLKIGGTTISTINSVSKNVTDVGFDIEFAFSMRAIGGSGSVYPHATAVFDHLAITDTPTAAVTVDTTTANDITLTIQWDNALAGNSVTISQGYTEYIG